MTKQDANIDTRILDAFIFKLTIVIVDATSIINKQKSLFEFKYLILIQTRTGKYVYIYIFFKFSFLETHSHFSNLFLVGCKVFQILQVIKFNFFLKLRNCGIEYVALHLQSFNIIEVRSNYQLHSISQFSSFPSTHTTLF